MNDTHKLEMLDDVIKSAQSAKMNLHKDRKAYAVDVVKLLGFSKSVFDSLKDEPELEEPKKEVNLWVI